jgi:large subunit ribosomal protein L24
MIKIRKNDRVQVITGNDAGKAGRVLEVYPEKHRLLVEHVHMIKRHTRPNPAKQIKGGIAEREAPIHVSNVLLVCPSCSKPVRIGFHFNNDGRKVRVCRDCQAVVDK